MLMRSLALGVLGSGGSYALLLQNLRLLPGERMVYGIGDAARDLRRSLPPLNPRAFRVWQLVGTSRICVVRAVGAVCCRRL